jgi:hypothetical protein
MLLPNFADGMGAEPILTTATKGGKPPLGRPGTGLSPHPFGSEEVPMIKALLTPIVLGLAVAMVIRLMTPRRAY